MRSIFSYVRVVLVLKYAMDLLGDRALCSPPCLQFLLKAAVSDHLHFVRIVAMSERMAQHIRSLHICVAFDVAYTYDIAFVCCRSVSVFDVQLFGISCAIHFDAASSRNGTWLTSAFGMRNEHTLFTVADINYAIEVRLSLHDSRRIARFGWPNVLVLEVHRTCVAHICCYAHAHTLKHIMTILRGQLRMC